MQRLSWSAFFVFFCTSTLFLFKFFDSCVIFLLVVLAVFPVPLFTHPKLVSSMFFFQSACHPHITSSSFHIRLSCSQSPTYLWALYSGCFPSPLQLCIVGVLPQSNLLPSFPYVSHEYFARCQLSVYTFNKNNFIFLSSLCQSAFWVQSAY